AQVTVTADTAPTGQEFDVWTGDTGVLADPAQAMTTVTMPASAATINATYKNTAPAGGADLRISSFTSNKTSVAVGESIEFSFVTVNDGSSDATNVETTLSLPFEAEWIWGSSGCSLNQDGDVVCVIGSIPNGSQRTRDVGVRVIDEWDTTATVYAYGDEIDPDTSNNSDSMELTIESGADMRVTISKSYPSGDPSVGRVANYKTRTYNDGPSAAPNAVMVFELPTDGTLHSKPPSCSINGDGDVECGFGTLNSGSYRTRTVGVRMQAVGTTTAYTSVESDADDSDWGNNDASLDVTVVP
ncbi:hypothetical protein, partial [Candidatus Albibeggiatoa sp. nov. BB20]|uniref:InlB B-repeat-containing protein n=1 Tax=Candidatus Albibeggiatoa sp. nov. BB20 TaxID=3162723 RepID=UPI00336584F1